MYPSWVTQNMIMGWQDDVHRGRRFDWESSVRQAQIFNPQVQAAHEQSGSHGTSTSFGGGSGSGGGGGGGSW